MKKLVTRVLVIGAALAGVIAVQAQDKVVKADVPFSFYIGSTVMPQGEYRINEAANGSNLWVTSRHAVRGATAYNITGKSENEEARLVFNCYSGDCFLSQVWLGGGRTGAGIPRSAREKELAKSGVSPVLAVIRLVQ